MIHLLRRQWRPERFHALLKPVVILVILLLAAYFGRRATNRLVLLVVLVVGGTLAFVILTRRLEWGLLVLIPVSLLVPWEIGTGTKVAVNATILLVPLLLGLWIFRMIAIEKAVRLAPSRVNTPALAFIVAVTVSLIAGGVRWIPFGEGASLVAQLGGWALYVFPLGLFLLVGSQIGDLRWLRVLTWLFLVLGGLYIVGRVVPWLGRVTGRFFIVKSTGSMFWTWLVALAFGQALLNRDLRPRWRGILGLLAATTLGVGWFQAKSWVSGWLPPLIAVVVIVWLRSWRWGLMFAIIAGVFLLLYYPAMVEQVMTPDQVYSTASRAATWPIMLELVKANPIIGLGPSNYYHYTPLYPIWGWPVKFNSHNNYWDIVAQTGLVGFGLFLWLVIEIGLLGWRLRKRMADGFSLGYVNGALGGLVGMLAAGWMGDWFLPFTYNIGFPGFRASIFAWLFLGGVLALEQMVRKDGD